MTVYMIVSCSDAFDSGRFPCTAYLPLPHVTPTQGWALDVDTARRIAWEQGWSQAPTGKDLCPSHTRAARNAEYVRLMQQAPPIDREQIMRDLGVDPDA
jgi:hypothetical protein